jgi:hypothetical protein
MYKVLMFGDRNYKHRSAVRREMRKLIRRHGTANLLIIEGGAPGADTMAKNEAMIQDVHCADIKALWDTRHRAAGPQRNKVMLSLEPNEGIGFHEDIEGSSKGSKDMRDRLEEAGIKVRIVKR